MIVNIIKFEWLLLSQLKRFWLSWTLWQLIVGWLFYGLCQQFMLYQQAHLISMERPQGITEEVLHPLFAWFALLSLLILPMFTTAQIATEKQFHRLDGYRLLAIPSARIFWGKYCFLLLILGGLFCTLVCMILSLSFSGALDLGQVTTSLLGLWLILSTALAIGLAISAWMNSTLSCLVTTYGVLCGLCLIEWAGDLLTGHFDGLQQWGFLYPLKHFLAGLFCVEDFLYYTACILIALGLGTWRFEREAFYESGGHR